MRDSGRLLASMDGAHPRTSANKSISRRYRLVTAPAEMTAWEDFWEHWRFFLASW